MDIPERHPRREWDYYAPAPINRLESCKHLKPGEPVHPSRIGCTFPLTLDMSPILAQIASGTDLLDAGSNSRLSGRFALTIR